MSFAKTDEQRLLSETLRRFLEDRNDFEARRRRLNEDPPQRMALWADLAELGMLGAAFDESFGGFGGDARSIATVMAELGRSLAVEPFLGCAVVAGRVLTLWRDADARETAILRLMAGEAVTILAHDAGNDPFAQPKLTASKGDDGYILSGRVRCVRHADIADVFLVTARLDDDLAIFQLPRGTDGLAVASCRLMDGAGGGDLQFAEVRLPAASRLEFDVPERAVIDDALEWGVLGLVAEACGIVEALNHATFQYLTTRKQFGQVLASFQALQHRAADMFVAAEELRAMADSAVRALYEPASAQRSACLSAAKAMADQAGRRVGHDAIQLHGGMGVSDELGVSHYGRRLAVIRAELGCVDIHRLRFASSEDVAGILAAQETPEAADWRRQVREFVTAHLPEDIGAKVALGLKIEKDDYVRWQKVLHEHGWFAGAWPTQYGGQGWDIRKQLVFTQEAAACNGPMIIPYSVSMVGPVLYTYGSDAQKKQHLPDILSSDVWWCQGYSEPGAGSDLASLKTFAERDGDHYVVNGAKMWTTEAHWADRMHCLVRTSRDGKPQTGISFLLIDMDTPGIEIKPIVTIDGIHHTNAVFFDNVRVPVANLVGEEGQGWGIAKFLLGNERVSIADTGPKLRLLTHLQALHRTMLASDDVPDAQKHLLTAKLADVSIQLLALCTMERFYVEAWADGATPGVDASVLKIRGTEILQALSEVALELEGPLAAAHDPADLHRRPDEIDRPSRHASLIGHEYLYGRCWSIFGGTNEIQRNIIAKSVLRA